MRNHVSESVTIDRLAEAALFSKYHFTRIFRSITGISPGHFMSAVRIQEAKRLLLSTRYTVADIGTSVGYASPSTFSARFTRSVGVGPAAFRGRHRPPTPIFINWLPPRCGTMVHGVVRTDSSLETGPIFVGLFPQPIAEGIPASWTVLPQPGPYRLVNPPKGRWHLVAYPVGPASACITPGSDRGIGARSGPLPIQVGIYRPPVNVTLRTWRDVDPPTLLFLPGVTC
ncbi:helix-turn-helix transcriptional regulator [Dactylosporangium sp. NPDC049525]|uniref:helix-turn-helix transcriptional regulator n=1 Tax=Dactylosporangium sp. NPDC049525 TaxID=3154730 RepID=UPI00341F0AED